MNVPKLRFKEFKDEWQSINLATVFQYFATNSFSRDQLSESGILKNLHYGDIHRKYNSIVNENDEITSYVKDINYNNKYELLKNNDLIFADASEDYEGIGKAVEVVNVNDKTISGLHTILARDNLNVFAPMFKGYYFNSSIVHNQLRVLANGFKVYGISKDSINKLNIKVPSTNEQSKIANTLYLLDKKIELQSEKIENLKLFKLYTENSLLNSSSSIHWKKLKLNDILIEGNKEPVKNTNDFKKITIKLNLNGLEFNESKREMSDKRPFYIREENEIIIGKQNYFNGSIAIVTKEFSGCICSNAIMSFKVKKGYNLKYIYLYLSQKRYMKKREFLANGTGQKELSEKEFLKFTIKVPEDSVVNNITNIIDKINKKINFENNKLNKLIELKKGLMQNMFV